MSHSTTAWHDVNIVNASQGYTQAQCNAPTTASPAGLGLPTTYSRFGVTFNLQYRNFTVNNQGEITAGQVYGTRKSGSTGSSGTATITLSAGAGAGTSYTDDMGYGTVTVRTGESTSGGGCADAINIQKALSNEGEAFMVAADTTFPTSVSGAFVVTRVGTTTRFAGVDGQDFPFSVSDGLGGSGLGGVYKEVNSIDDLPVTAPHNFKVKIIGDLELAQDDYYVKFSVAGDGNFGTGTWEETNGFRESLGLNQQTMPLKIISKGKNAQGVDLFDVNVAYWDNRQAGDNDSNPHPSFVGTTINNMSWFKNRLVMLTDDTVVMSEAGEPYNFYKVTVTQLLDSAPIDVTVATNSITNLRYAVGYQENLVLFSDREQFVLRGGQLLSNDTVSISPITNFEINPKVSPIALGAYLYYPFNRNDFSGVHQYFVNANTDNYDAQEITEHVPSYLPSNISVIKGSSVENILIAMSHDEPTTLYVYRYFMSGGSRILSSWSKFKFDHCCTNIVDFEFIEGTLYLIMIKAGETHLLKMPFQTVLSNPENVGSPSANEPNIYLDFASDANLTGTAAQSFNLGFKITATQEMEAYRADTGASAYTYGGIANAGNLSVTPGAAGSGRHIVGIPYTMKYTFSEQLFKAPAGTGKTPTNSAKLMIRSGTVFFDKTNAIDIKVTPALRGETTQSFSQGGTTIDDGKFKFGVLAPADNTVITLENSGALQSDIQSAEFESYVAPRSERIR
tara:strand:+ start:2140 stop:4341 length:2202 start_codon:yes stop_codon:yes gene_type:complete